MYPSREEFTELIYYISELKHQYSGKIDEQTIKINDQSGVIEELLWQIRELSDKLRQMNEKVMDLEKLVDENQRTNEDKCVCRYENHIPRNRSIFSRQTSMLSRRGTVRRRSNAKKVSNGTFVDKTIDDDGNDVYETIEFSDSSSQLYTEPVAASYGVLRKVNIKTSPKLHHNKNKPPSGLKKTSGTRNLQKYTASEDISKTSDDEPVELRLKPRSPGLKQPGSKPENIMTVGHRSAIYSHRKFGQQLYPTTRCFGYLNQFRMFKTKAKK